MTFPYGFTPQIVGDRAHQIELRQAGTVTEVRCTCGVRLGYSHPTEGPDPVLALHRAHLENV